MNVLASELKKIAIKAGDQPIGERISFIMWVKEEASLWAKDGKLRFEFNTRELGAWQLFEIRNSLISLKNDGFRCSLESGFLKVSWE